MTEPAEQRSEIVITPDVHRYTLEQTRMNLDSGFLGKFFGSATNAPTNIAGLVVLLLMLMNFILIFVPSTSITAGDFLKQVLLPIITLVFGYLFGKKTGE